jgi:hypothetical protein
MTEGDIVQFCLLASAMCTQCTVYVHRNISEKFSWNRTTAGIDNINWSKFLFPHGVDCGIVKRVQTFDRIYR